jgi:hypothetical protein
MINKTNVLILALLFKPLGFITPISLSYVAFQSFNFACTRWRLVNKRIVYTKFDIYVFITITGSIPLLVDYASSRVSPAQLTVLRHWHGLLDIFMTEIYSS